MNRVSVKRLLALVLAAAVFIAVNASPAAVWAAEMQEPVTITASASKINPLYAGGNVPDSGGVDAQSAENLYADDIDEAAEELRYALMHRKTSIVLSFPVDIPLDMNHQDAFWETLWELEEEIYQKAVSHTGNPWEGDYLRYNVYGCEMDVNAYPCETITVELAYTFTYNATAQQEEQVDAAVDALLAQWDLDDATDYEKVCAVYDWLCENVTYSETIVNYNSPIYSAYGALVDKNCVCQGYATAMYRLLLELGVDCRVIAGTSHGENHAWNIVKLGDRWYNADATWDADYAKLGMDYQWFLTSEANFPDHTREDEFGTASFYTAYPMSEADYDPTQVSPEPNPEPNYIAKGACGDNLTWALEENGTLTISGTGAMYEYPAGNPAPWYDLRDSVKRVIIENGATNISERAFADCESMVEITLANTLTHIGYEAFAFCKNLKEITIPEGVTEIRSWAFVHCYSLEIITIPSTVTSIGKAVFVFCNSLTEITIPDSVTTMGERVFSNCPGLEKVKLSENLTGIGNETFAYCDSLTEITIPKSVTSIGQAIFKESANLSSITVAAGNPVYHCDGNCVIETASKTLVAGCTVSVIPTDGSVTAIGDGAFGGYRATEITIPEGVKVIGNKAFEESGLTEITIPKSVISIGSMAFAGCDALQTVYFEGNAPQKGIDKNAFLMVEATVSYPAGDATYTDAVKQNYDGTLTWVPYGEAARFVEAYGTSVSLGDSLEIHFFMEAADVEETDYAVLTRTYADGRADQVLTVPTSYWDVLDSSLVYITYTGIAAKEMGDEISIVIYDKDGNPISEVWTDSIASYAMRKLESETDPELLTLLVDMLNYGAEAQNYFGYDTEHPVNGELTETQKGYATGECETESHLDAGVGRVATALTLKSRISLDIFFDNSVIGTNYTDLYVIAEYTDHYGVNTETTISGCLFQASENGCAYISVPYLAVADYGQMITCTVYDADGNALAWAADSIEGYAHRMADQLPEMVQSIVKFGNSAYQYFH